MKNKEFIRWLKIISQSERPIRGMDAILIILKKEYSEGLKFVTHTRASSAFQFEFLCPGERNWKLILVYRVVNAKITVDHCPPSFPKKSECCYLCLENVKRFSSSLLSWLGRIFIVAGVLQKTYNHTVWIHDCVHRQVHILLASVLRCWAGYVDIDRMAFVTEGRPMSSMLDLSNNFD